MAAALLAGLLLAGTAGAQAGPQAPGGAIRGSVVDAATGRPIASATVGVWSVADSTLVTGAMTRPDGSFTVEGLRQCRYYERAS
jgi:hypothetical protein